MVESAKRTAPNVCQLHMALLPEDVNSYADMHGPITHFHHVKEWPTVYSWNLLAQEAMKDPFNKLFMLAADDMIFATPGWDKALIEHYEGLENKIHVYHLRDSRNDSGTPHPIVTREYIEAMGYFMVPIFLHWFVDTWCCCVASANGVFTHLKDFLLVHDKPSDKGQPDETHSRIRRMGWHERDKYVNDMCGHFLEEEKGRLAGAILDKYGYVICDNDVPEKYVSKR